MTDHWPDDPTVDTTVPDDPRELLERWREVPSNGRCRDLDPPLPPRAGMPPSDETLERLGLRPRKAPRPRDDP